VVFLKDRQTGRCNASDNFVPEPRIIKNPGKQVAWELFATFSGIPASIGACHFSKPARSPRRAQAQGRAVRDFGLGFYGILSGRAFSFSHAIPFKGWPQT
jgi:hypothetical protein